MKPKSPKRLPSVTWVFIFVVGVVVVILAWLVAKDFATVTGNRPVISQNKDWIDVFASLGEGFGVIALIALIFEMYKHREEIRSRSVPRLKVHTFEIVRSIPQGAVCCLCEEDRSQLPELRDEEDYRNLWYANSKKGDAFLCITLTNEQPEFEGSARDVRIDVKLTYSRTKKPNQSQADQKQLRLPPSTMEGLSIDSGKHGQIFLKLGLADYPYVGAVVHDVRCKNIRGDNFTGSRMGFQERRFPISQYATTED